MIALKWRERQACASGQWITELSSNLTLDKLTYMKLKSFTSSFLPFIKNLNMQTPEPGRGEVPPPLWPRDLLLSSCLESYYVVELKRSTKQFFCVLVYICVHISFATGLVEAGEEGKKVDFSFFWVCVYWNEKVKHKQVVTVTPSQQWCYLRLRLREFVILRPPFPPSNSTGLWKVTAALDWSRKRVKLQTSPSVCDKFIHSCKNAVRHN